MLCALGLLQFCTKIEMVCDGSLNAVGEVN